MTYPTHLVLVCKDCGESGVWREGSLEAWQDGEAWVGDDGKPHFDGDRIEHNGDLDGYSWHCSNDRCPNYAKSALWPILLRYRSAPSHPDQPSIG